MNREDLRYGKNKEQQPLPEEYPVPGEGQPPAEEFYCPGEQQSLPDEYSVPEEFSFTEKDSPAQGAEKRSPVRRGFRMLCMLGAFSLLAFVVYHSEDRMDAVTGQPGTEENRDAAANGSEESKTAESDSTEPDGEQTKTEETGEEQTGITGLEDGVVYYTVYNDSYDAGGNYVSGLVLDQGELDAKSLSEGGSYKLPDPVMQEGFVFLGFVVRYKSTEGTEVRLLRQALTAEDVVSCKPDENGNRTVEIHAAWRNDGIKEKWANLLTLQANGGAIEGAESMQYDAATPLASGGAAYLVAYPEPVREGYRFTGWYETADCDGKPKLWVNATAFYEQGDVEPDWNAPKEITLYAGWEKEN